MFNHKKSYGLKFFSALFAFEKMFNFAAFPIRTRINQHSPKHLVDGLFGIILGGCLSDLLDPPISVVSSDLIEKV